MFIRLTAKAAEIQVWTPYFHLVSFCSYLENWKITKLFTEIRFYMETRYKFHRFAKSFQIVFFRYLNKLPLTRLFSMINQLGYHSNWFKIYIRLYKSDFTR